MKQLLLVVALFAVALLLAGCPGGEPNTITYSGPTEQTIPMGQGIPGSDIRYVGYSDAGAQIIIGDQKAVKKVGDSLDWKGTPVPGVSVSMTQRILLASEERLQTVGTVKVTIDDVQPQAAQFPDKPAFSYKVAMSHTVRKGDRIPGTLVSYKGKAAEGAEFEGVSGYPYRKIGDSLSWSGRLRGNTYIEMTLRVIAYADGFVTLGGLADVGLTQ